MANTKRKYPSGKALADYYIYVPLGAAQIVAEKAKELSGTTVGTVKRNTQNAVDFVRGGRENVLSTYDDLAKRGKSLASSIGRMSATQRAATQFKTARSSFRRAARATSEATKATATATRAAAKKVG
ncbi:MAG: hypothetical protein M3N24_06515 [Actinomycetota bacterium]|nr:hypothetical protein [Actinomycetota bacterium]